ncbi:hypothetical protein ACKAV7_010695 [Fusarium commune]
MSTNFRDRAIAEVQKAITADHNKYQNLRPIHVLHGTLGQGAQMATYLDRAEKLKQFLAAENENSNGGGKAIMGANGSSTGKGKPQAAEDDDSKKLRNALSGAILQERPNVRLFQGKRQAWKGILLYGPPGTGKSYLAKAVATEANSTFFSISSSDLVSKWMGESESSSSPWRAKTSPQLSSSRDDALCGPRGEGESEGLTSYKTEILVQMDGVGNDSKGILVLAPPIIPCELDAASRRRFQRRVHIGLPDITAKSDGMSGSAIANVVQSALMRPVRKILQATHFKPVMKDGKRMLTPCSPGDPEKIEMTYDDVSSDELLAPDVALKDFEMALDDSHPTVSKDDIARQIEWTNEFGSEGA